MPQHLGGELFKLSAGIDMVHVPFRGATAAIPDLLAGRIDVFIGAINSLLPLIKEGKLRAIAMAGKTRVPSLPDVPTIAELAFPDYELGSAVGLVAPAGTPPDVVETLNGEIELKGVSGEIEASTVSGKIRVEGDQIERAELRTMAGEIELETSLAEDARVFARSYSGAVRLRLPKHTSARFDVQSFSGGVKSEFASL